MSNLAYEIRYTYEDYKQWEGDWELIWGQAIAMAPSPFGPHQGIMSEIVFDLKSSLQQCNKECFVYAELDYIVDEETVVRPDVLVSCQKIRDFAKKAPLFIAEVLSPSTAIKDQNIKFSIYEAEGVRYYMIVDYNIQKVKLYKLIGGKYQKVAEEIDGEMRVDFDGCELIFNIDRWWQVV